MAVFGIVLSPCNSVQIPVDEFRGPGTTSWPQWVLQAEG